MCRHISSSIGILKRVVFLNANIADLANYDACYVPLASPVWEPVNIAASQVIKKIQK
ncbi:MAG TPA: hypothetical protein VFY64_11670 [Nitrososphaeraceae archaeon]|nr:hypothetical protein [Nitrososphaeraceae archaeon]